MKIELKDGIGVGYVRDADVCEVGKDDAGKLSVRCANGRTFFPINNATFLRAVAILEGGATDKDARIAKLEAALAKFEAWIVNPNKSALGTELFDRLYDAERKGDATAEAQIWAEVLAEARR